MWIREIKKKNTDKRADNIRLGCGSEKYNNTQTKETTTLDLSVDQGNIKTHRQKRRKHNKT